MWANIFARTGSARFGASGSAATTTATSPTVLDTTQWGEKFSLTPQNGVQTHVNGGMNKIGPAKVSRNRRPNVMAIPGARMPTQLIRGLPPGRLSDNVRSVGRSKAKMMPCNTEMTALLNCFKEFDFETDHCMREHRILEDCVTKTRNDHLEKLLQKKRGSEGKDFVPWEELDSKQLAKEIQKYPTGIRPESFKTTLRLKMYRK